MMNGRRPSTASTLSEPGADSRMVLAGLGYAPERIEALLAAGSVG
jgi:hypothetical protein